VARSRFALSFGQKLDLDLVVGEEAPSATEAVVVPQDVNLIMGEVEAVEDTDETAEEVLHAAAVQRPRRLGSLVVGPSRAGTPIVLQAVVYDFDRSPPTREDVVFEALISAFEEAKVRGLGCLAVRPLGTAYAGVDPSAFLRLLTQVCYSSAELGTSLRRVHLLLPSPEEMRRYEALLHGLMQRRGKR
jgi:hypothetical protein